MGEIKQIPGLSGVTPGDELKVEENQRGEFRVRLGPNVVSLNPDQAKLFLSRDLSEAEKLEVGLNFKTGEITTPGTLTCKKCEKKIKMYGTGHIPPCPECRGTEFHKGY